MTRTSHPNDVFKMVAILAIIITWTIVSCRTQKESKASQDLKSPLVDSLNQVISSYILKFDSSERRNAQLLDSAGRAETDGQKARQEMTEMYQTLTRVKAEKDEQRKVMLNAQADADIAKLKLTRDASEQTRLEKEIAGLRAAARQTRVDTGGLNNRPSKSDRVLGEIVFYCPREMREGESRTVTATIGQMIKEPVIRSIMRDQINRERAQLKQAPITDEDLRTESLHLLDSVEVLLLDPGERMKGTDSPDHTSWRKVDTAAESWNWLISPKNGEGGKADIDLFLTVRTKGNQNSILNYLYPIKINLPQTLWQAFLKKLLDIGWLFATVGSIIGFLVKHFWDKKKSAGQVPNNTE